MANKISLVEVQKFPFVKADDRDSAKVYVAYCFSSNAKQFANAIIASNHSVFMRVPSSTCKFYLWILFHKV